MASKHLLLGLARVLPGWTSSMAVAGVFLAVWAAPDWLGWDEIAELELAVIGEVAGVYCYLFFVAGTGESIRWWALAPLALAVGVALAVLIDPLIGGIMAVHLVLRSLSVQSDVRTNKAVFGGVGLSISLMAICWLAVGLLPLPELGWTSTDTPYDLWWEMPAWTGSERLPYALPAWAFAYFFLTALVDAGRHFLAFVERTSLKATLGAT